MMWGMNPYQQQQAMIQQQAMFNAQQAYQQSMYAAMSMAGSQVGGNDDGGRTTSPMPPGQYGMPPIGYGTMPPFMPPYMSPPIMGGSPMLNPYMSGFPGGAGGYAGSNADFGAMPPQSRMSSFNLNPDRTGEMREQRTGGRTGSPARTGGMAGERDTDSPRPAAA